MATRDASAPSIADAPRPSGAVRALACLSQRLEILAEAERDQLPLWLPVALLLGVGAWFALPDEKAWIAFLLLAGTAALASLAVAPGTRWGRALLIFSLTAALGCGLIWWKAESAAAPRLERARMMALSAEVESIQPLAAEQSVRLVVRPIGEGLP
ncbi:MAG TPA: hypothetical protein VLK25_08965, partial [Allosphingosinicella sp.]|nr:hypothetical protein [Allosphingosinicella sp.]